MIKAIAAPAEVIQEAYLDWLGAQVCSDKFDTNSRLLLAHLHCVEWYSVVERDRAREEDGKKLRGRFIQDSDFINYESINGPCTFLECVIGIADRMDFFCTPPEDQSQMWMYFWLILSNSGIIGNGTDISAIDRKINKVLERTYATRGRGGFFPLKKAMTNQIGTEIWYQMSAYIEENPDLYKDLCSIFRSLTEPIDGSMLRRISLCV